MRGGHRRARPAVTPSASSSPCWDSLDRLLPVMSLSRRGEQATGRLPGLGGSCLRDECVGQGEGFVGGEAGPHGVAAAVVGIDAEDHAFDARCRRDPEPSRDQSSAAVGDHLGWLAVHRYYLHTPTRIACSAGSRPSIPLRAGPS